MHRTANPFIVPAGIQATADHIMASAQTRFGCDAFRMEDSPAEDEAAKAAAAAAAAEAEKAKNKATEAGNATDAEGKDLGYPKDTPTAEMTDKQQVAYWKHNSRRHEGRVKDLAGERTPEQVKADLTELDKLRKEQQTPAEQALAAAREEGKAEATKAARTQSATDIFRASLEDGGVEGDDLEEIVANFNVSNYVTDTGVDTTKIRNFAKKFSAPGTGTQRRVPDFGGGKRREQHGSGDRGAAGKAEAARRFAKSKSD